MEKPQFITEGSFIEAAKRHAEIKSENTEKSAEAKILEKIKETKKELNQIGSAFNIDTDGFSDENDKKFAEEASEKKKLQENYCSSKNIDIREISGTEYEFEIDEKIRKNKFLKYSTVGGSFLRYTLSQVERVEKEGKISDSDHDNIFEDIMNFEQIFLPNEWESLKKLKEIRPMIKFGLRDMLVDNQVMLLKNDNETVKKFCDILEQKNLTISKNYGGLHNAITYITEEDNWSEAEINILRNINKELREEADKEVADINSSYGRILVNIVKVFHERAAYLVERINSDNPDFSINPEKSEKEGFNNCVYITVPKDFKMTKDYAQEAQKANLPWSKYEKELG